MAANKIILKIEEDGAREVAKLLEGARKKAAVAAEKILSNAQAKVTEIEAQAILDADEAARRQVLIAELEARKNTLDSKRAVIETAFTQAAEELKHLTTEQWERLITSIVLRASETGTEALCVPAADVSKYEQGLLAKLNTALQQVGKKGELTLAEQRAGFSGGVLLVGKNSDFDGSFATILREVRIKVEKDVAALLFATEVK
ncbi:MAG: V-type ATP synthase subunit E family protein [Acidaminococcaceae bacterium]